MIDNQERHYNILKLNRWFALSSILFVLIWILTFAYDYQRPWKKFQKEFRNLEIEQVRSKIAEASLDLGEDEDYQALLKELESARAELESKQNEESNLEDRIQSLEAEQYRANQQYQFSKAKLDVAKYNYEQALSGHGDVGETRMTMEMLDKSTRDNHLSQEKIEGELSSTKQKLRDIRSTTKKLNDRLGIMTRKRDLQQRKLEKTDPSEMTFFNKLGNIIRDLPIIDFVDPYYKVKQVVVKDLTEDLVFLKMPKVDRCITCHAGIEKQGYEDAPQPYTTHPQLELYLSPNSPHPLTDYGCTSCHHGRGRGTDFTSAAHSPENAEQGLHWEETYGWEPLHHWNQPMLPKKYLEAGCYKCHSGPMPVVGAPKLSLGLAIVEKGGCFGCHQIERWEDTPKPGPGLRKIALKVTRDWAYKWINSPRDFRHDTWMPHFFRLENTHDEESQKRTDQEIHAIVSYLFDRSEPFDRKPIPVEGDSENGRLLVNSLGCLGCHRLEPYPNGDYVPSIQAMRLEQGPNLIDLGSKTNARWVFNWIKDPQKYYPDSKMPNLRLSDQETADVASFLMDDRNLEFDQTMVPPIDESELDKIVISFMEQTQRREEVTDRLLSMSLKEKLDYSGEKLIRHYGCFGCHDIGGFEDAKPIGTPLTFEGSKLTTKLDFAYLHNELPHTKWDWFNQKLDNPRIFDLIPGENGEFESKVKRPLEKLRMPHFGMSQDEIDAVVSVLMGFVKDEIPANKLPARTTRNLIVEEGQRLIQTYNCKGCHSINGDGGAIQPAIADWVSEIGGSVYAEDASLVQSFSPPMLDHEGKKIQPQWLFQFLKNPTMIRPNLTVRMPTFNLSDDEWNRIIKYFMYKDDQLLAYERDHTVKRSSTNYKAGEVIQEFGACKNCHFYGSKKPLQAPLTWAPDLAMSSERLRSEWIVDWLRDPQSIMPGTKMPAPYLPFEDPLEDVRRDWGSEVAKLHGDQEAMLNALRDYVWNIEGRQDITSLVRKHIAENGYGFVVEEEDEWDDW